MSPEQAEKPGEVDHRADIYSLGVVFYEMLTGELPGKELQPPSRKVQIDVRLDEIVLRALEKNPERRYQQASVFKTQVETISADAGKSEVRSSKSEAAHPRVTPVAATDWRRIIQRAAMAGFAVWLVTVLTAGIVSFLMADSYAAQARVILRRMVPAEFAAQSVPLPEIGAGEMDNQVGLLRSGIMLGKVITNLNLDQEWGRKYAGGEPLQTSATVELLKRRMVVSATRELITIQCFDEDPTEAARLANAIADGFIGWHAEIVGQQQDRPTPKPSGG